MRFSFLLLSCLVLGTGCSTYYRAPASLSDQEPLSAIRERFQVKRKETHFKGKYLDAETELNGECTIVLIDSTLSKKPLDHIHLRGTFTRGKEGPTAGVLNLGVSLGEKVNFTRPPLITNYLIDIETVRRSYHGGLVREGIVIQGHPGDQDFKVRFTVKPLTMGLALPFDRTEMECTGLVQIK